jgi:putative redox protein
MNDDKRTVESACVALAEGMHFVGDVDGFRIDLDAEEDFGGRSVGTQPLRLLLLSIAGCTAMDVLSILRKKRQQVSGLEVGVQGNRVDEHPRVYDRVEIIYRVKGTGVDPKAVERAIELSETRYCPAIAMLQRAAEIASRYEIEEEA